MIYFDCVMYSYAIISIFLNKNVVPPKKTNGVILHPYLPITATSLQRPLTSVPKVTIVERFDCSLDSRYMLLISYTETLRVNFTHTVLVKCKLSKLTVTRNSILETRNSKTSNIKSRVERIEFRGSSFKSSASSFELRKQRAYRSIKFLHDREKGHTSTALTSRSQLEKKVIVR